jgi:hypothetical protein
MIRGGSETPERLDRCLADFAWISIIFNSVNVISPPLGLRYSAPRTIARPNEMTRDCVDTVGVFARG